MRIQDIIERKYELPKMEKNGEGYAYPSDMWGEVFIYNKNGNDHLYFVSSDGKTINDVPTGAVNEIIKEVFKKVEETTLDSDKIENIIDEKSTEIKSELQEDFKNKNEYIKSVLSKVITDEVVDEKINENLKSVHTKYEKVARKFVEEKVDELKSEIIKSNPNKPKSSTITSLIKEEGFTIEEVKQLHEAGLI